MLENRRRCLEQPKKKPEKREENKNDAQDKTRRDRTSYPKANSQDKTRQGTHKGEHTKQNKVTTQAMHCAVGSVEKMLKNKEAFENQDAFI
jgi:hypothetical protein